MHLKGSLALYTKAAAIYSRPPNLYRNEIRESDFMNRDTRSMNINCVKFNIHTL
jgi:hypothetical protein